MKQLILCLLVCFLTADCLAQEVYVSVSKKTSKVVFEHVENLGNHLLYAYAETSVNNTVSIYTQFFYEYSFNWVNTHIEYRSLFAECNNLLHTAIVGFSFPILNKNRCEISLSPLYRYDYEHQWQATMTYRFVRNRFVLEGYIDVYGTSIVHLFSENKFKVYFNDLFIGINIEYLLNNRVFNINPFLMFGYSF